MSQQNDTTSRVIIVTGGGSGIGAATALRFAAGGATVVIVGRNTGKLAEVAAQASGPGRIVPRPADVTDEAAMTALVNEVAERHGRLDVLVNNAGIAVQGSAEQTSTAEWRAAMAVFVDAAFFTSRAAIPHLRATQGSIVNVSSTSGIRADWGLLAYNTAKAAVLNLTRAMALDHGRDGIRINAVAPGLTLTDMNAHMRALPGVTEAFAARIPMGRGADPAEIGDVIVFLASHDARYITGAVLPVDGGVSASSGAPSFA